MQQRAVHDQWNGHRQVQEGEPVGEEDPRPFRYRRHVVEHVKEQYQPEDGVYRLEGELGGGEEQREERYVSGDCERLEGAVVPAVFERDQAERDDDQENGLFVHVPAEEEGGVAAESDGADERLPVGAEPEFDQRQLHGISTLLQTRG